MSRPGASTATDPAPASVREPVGRRLPSVRIGLLRMFFRHLRTGGVAGGAVAVLVVVVTGLLTAAPGLVDRAGVDELRYQVAHLSPTFRFLTTRTFQRPPIGAAPDGRQTTLPPDTADTWGQLDVALTDVRNAAPQPLREHMGNARFSVFTPSIGMPQPPAAANVVGKFSVVLAADPRIKESAVLVTGKWPAATSQPPSSDKPIGIALSVATANRFGWKVGEVRQTDPLSGALVNLVLTGIFTDRAGSEDYWTLNRSILKPIIQLTLGPELVTGTAFVHAASWTSVRAIAGQSYLQIYFPFDSGGMRSSDIEPIRTQILQFADVATQLKLPSGTDPQVAQSLRFASRTPATLSAVLGSIGTAVAVLSVLAIGPIGAAIAVLVLSCRLLAGRRRSAFGLLAARGASRRSLRVLIAAEALLLAVPAGVVGVVVALSYQPPDSIGPALVPPILAVLTVAVLVPAAAGGRRPIRADVSVRSTARFRWIAEMLLVALAAVSTFLLYRSGPSAPGTGLDPLVVGAPLMICLAACFVVIRLFPAPLLLLHNLFRRRRGMVGFLGSARATREPAIGVVPILAIMTGVAMAVLAAVVLSTLRNGVTAAARSEVGADLRVDRVGLSADDVATVRAVPGIRRVAPVETLTQVTVGVGGVQQNIQVYLADTADLAQVQSGIAGSVPLPPGMTTSRSGAVPVVVSDDLVSPGIDQDRRLAVGETSLEPVGTAVSTAGVGHATQWILADEMFHTTFGTAAFDPETLLIQLTPGADVAGVGAAVEAAIPGAVVQTPEVVAAQLRGSPLVGGLRAAVDALVVLMGLLCATAVVMSAAANAPARTRTLGVLRILGLRPRAATSLVAWELVPVTTAAAVGGALVGAGLVQIMIDVIDLRPFTGGTGQPGLTAGFGELGLLVGGFVVLVAGAIAVSAATAHRMGLAQVLRFGEAPGQVDG